MKPPIPITDRRFVYTDSANTNLRKTFERIRREQKLPVLVNVRDLRKVK